MPPKPTAEYRSSSEVMFSRLSTSAEYSGFRSVASGWPWRRAISSSISRPRWMFSSRFSRLNHWRMRLRAVCVLTILSQSRLGPGWLLEVMISTMSLVLSL